MAFILAARMAELLRADDEFFTGLTPKCPGFLGMECNDRLATHDSALCDWCKKEKEEIEFKDECKEKLEKWKNGRHSWYTTRAGCFVCLSCRECFDMNTYGLTHPGQVGLVPAAACCFNADCVIAKGFWGPRTVSHMRAMVAVRAAKKKEPLAR